MSKKDDEVSIKTVHGQTHRNNEMLLHIIYMWKKWYGHFLIVTCIMVFIIFGFLIMNFIFQLCISDKIYETRDMITEHIKKVDQFIDNFYPIHDILQDCCPINSENSCKPHQNENEND